MVLWNLWREHLFNCCPCTHAHLQIACWVHIEMACFQMLYDFTHFQNLALLMINQPLEHPVLVLVQIYYFWKSQATYTPWHILMFPGKRSRSFIIFNQIPFIFFLLFCWVLCMFFLYTNNKMYINSFNVYVISHCVYSGY